MKKLLALLCSFVLMIELLSGCGKADRKDTVVHIGSLKGATTIGLVSLMEKNQKGEAIGQYEFTMVTAADELMAMMVKGELDIALVPANMASVLYQKMSGEIRVIDINTLGVLYMISENTSIKSMEDLKGKTIYLTGKGTVPDFTLQYLLTESGIGLEEVNLEYKAEATEVAATLSEHPEAVGMLPQPFVTATCAQNESLVIILDMTEEWSKVQGEEGSSLVTGVTIVRNEFLEENKAAVDNFIEEHIQSASYANTNVNETAELVVAAEIIAKAPLAKKAIPKCNIVCIVGKEMKTALEGYLEILYTQSPEAVGGKLPEDNFYYGAK